MTGQGTDGGRSGRTRRRFVRAAAAAGGVGLAGCSGAGFDTEDGATPTGDETTSAPNWPAFRGDPANTGSTAAAGPEGAPDARWTASVGGPGLSSPVVADGLVLAGAAGGLRAFTTDGDPAWEAPTDAAVTATPTVDGGAAYAVDADRTLYAVETGDGSVRWRAALRAEAFGFGRATQQVDPNVASSPTVVDGTAYVGGRGGAVYAFDARTGDPVWRTGVPGDGYPPRGQVATPAVATPAVVDGTVYAAAGRTVAALDADTGDPAWRTEAPAPVTASPAVREGVVHVASLDGTVLALDAGTWEVEWTASRGEAAYPPARSGQERLVVDSSPAVAAASGGTAIVLRGERGTYAFDGAGDPLWSVPDAGGSFGTQERTSPVRSSPAVGTERAYVGTDRGVVGVGLADGERRFTFETDASVVSSPALVDGTLYAVDRDGTLYALRA